MGQQSIRCLEFAIERFDTFRDVIPMLAPLFSRSCRGSSRSGTHEAVDGRRCPPSPDCCPRSTGFTVRLQMECLSAITGNPHFRPRPTVHGIFGEPKARVITLNRRSKKQPAAVAVASTWAGTTGRCAGYAIYRLRPQLGDQVFDLHKRRARGAASGLDRSARSSTSAIRAANACLRRGNARP